MLHPVCREYGTRRVWANGMEKLGYPPTWITGGGELFRLRVALH